MKIIDNKITTDELKQMSQKMYGNLVKAVVDIEREIMVVDGDLHADEETFLLENESKQDNLWGINLHPGLLPNDDWIEFDSMINIRPSLGNRSRYINSPEIRKKIVAIVNKLVIK